MEMTFEELKPYLQQRFPFIMVDRVLEIEPGKRIKALRNVTANEIQFLGHFPAFAIMPGVFIVEAIGQAASILFSLTFAQDKHCREHLVLGTVNDMKFFAPVLPGHTMILEVSILTMMPTAALVEGIVTVEGAVVAKGKLAFARKVLG
jgi:3-hydroxyacyl-[acyl-carrier-protein] dehydratase